MRFVATAALAALLVFPSCTFYSYRDRIVAVKDLQTSRPASFTEINFNLAEIILIPPRPKTVKARLDRDGKALMHLPTTMSWASVGQSSELVNSNLIRNGGTLLLRLPSHLEKTGPHDGDVKEVGGRPRYELVITKASPRN
jgi:hypothetical protein